MKLTILYRLRPREDPARPNLTCQPSTPPRTTWNSSRPPDVLPGLKENLFKFYLNSILINKFCPNTTFIKNYIQTSFSNTTFIKKYTKI
jgi:hypothetical protein